MTEAKTGSIAPPSLERGSSIGRYVVLALVGRGAMGEVYAAYDPELDRKVAVKLLRTQVGADDLTAAEAKTRLLREGQAIARLSHPNVIVVHDVGSFGDRVFVAMEFVDGHTVGYWLLAAKRSWKEVLRVFMAAGRGLAAAHASQVVHRDFKVENVMVGRDGQVRVMDFGLARRVAAPLAEADSTVAPLSRSGTTPAGMLSAAEVLSAAEDEGVMVTRILTPTAGVRVPQPSISDSPVGTPTRVRRLSGAMETVHTSLSTELTQTGAIIGTPAYMAPEQFSGKPADERSDQFSFCVALYEGLHGERPFAGKTVAELSRNVLHGRMRAAPDATGVPGWLRRVVLRGLRTNPAERWPSMEALLDALQKDPGVVWRRWAMVAAATAGIAGIGIAARRQGARDNRPTCQVAADRFAHVWEPNAAPGGRRAQIANSFRANGQPYAADAFAGAARLLDRYVGAWSSMYKDSCEATNVRGEQSPEVLDLRMSCLRDRWNELRALSAVLAEPDNRVVANAVKAASALTPLDRCADVRTLRAAVPPPNDPAVRERVETLRAKLATAKALEDAGGFAKALVAAAELVAEARTTGYMPFLAEAMARLGGIQSHMGRAAEAEATLDEAVWTAQAARHDEIVVSSSVEQIYVAGYLEHDMVRARRWLRQSEAFLARLEGHELLRAWMLNNFGVALDAHGDLDEALSRYRSALQIKERVLGSLDPDVGTSMTNLASTLMALGRPGEALEYSNRGVAMVGQALGPEHPDTALQLGVRADILNRVGRYADARRDAERALVIWERELGREHVDLPFFLGPLGEAELGLEDPAGAAVHLDRALKIPSEKVSAAELRKLRFGLARALWESNRDQDRALKLGLLAASDAASDDAGGASERARDRELQERAKAWVAAHREGSRGSGAALSRLTGRTVVR
jgi:serine/threonine protein kinase/tetratricopeptide (TPR) repeat protein